MRHLTDASLFTYLLCLATISSCSITEPRVSSPVGPRMTMMELHEAGGVPPGWQFALPRGNPEGGRRAFADFGCPSCHLVRGEDFEPPDETQPGPELTGMGAHHPPEYFGESILNPNAVLVDGPGYIGPDGRSIMPEYPDMQLAELADLVAYIESLRMEGHADHAHRFPGERPSLLREPPPGFPMPSPGEAKAFLVRVFDIEDDKIAEFEKWYAGRGVPSLLAYPGLVSVDTYVDHTCGSGATFTVLGFSSEEDLDGFLRSPEAIAILREQIRTAQPLDDFTFLFQPLYRVERLSGP